MERFFQFNVGSIHCRVQRTVTCYAPILTMYPSAFVRYSRELLLPLRPSSVRHLTPSLCIACNTECLAEPLRRFRGCPAGQHVQLRHTPFNADVNTNAMSVLIGNRPSPRQRKSQQPETHKIPPSSALIRVVSRPTDPSHSRPDQRAVGRQQFGEHLRSCRHR